jgi:uncharacterized protein (TIGR03435 family)
MKHALVSMLAAAAIFVVVNAQDGAPVPYVASVKKNAGGFGGQIRIAPGLISVNGMPVRILIRQAFGQLQDFQLVGGPSWISSDRFDIEAKPEGGGPMTPQVLQSVFRQILEDRFSLKVHKETRELPVYALTVARTDGRLGPNLKLSSDECSTRMAARGRGPAPDGRGGPPPDGRGGVAVGRGGPPADGRGGPGRAGGPPPAPDWDAPPVCGQRGGGFGRMRAGGTTMADFAAMISGTAQRVVVDKTGLTGYYDIALTYTPAGDQLPQGPPPPGAPPPPPIDPDGPSFFTAIQEQLGLRLDNQRGPVEVVVIDSIEQPTEN